MQKTSSGVLVVLHLNSRTNIHGMSLYITHVEIACNLRHSYNLEMHHWWENTLF